MNNHLKLINLTVLISHYKLKGYIFYKTQALQIDALIPLT